jgi:hypothetical protein
MVCVNILFLFFYYWIAFHYIDILEFIDSWVVSSLGAITNKAAKNFGVGVYFCGVGDQTKGLGKRCYQLAIPQPLYKCLCEYMLLFFGKYLGVELLGYMVSTYLPFNHISKLFSKVVGPFYISTSCFYESCSCSMSLSMLGLVTF